MDNYIAIISTYQLVIQNVITVLEQKDLGYPALLTSFDSLQSDAADAISRGARVFISRGQSAVILKQKFDIPVVMLRFTYYDFCVALQKAKELCQKVAIIGYNASWISSLELYRDALLNPTIVYLDSSSDLEVAIIELKRNGIGAIVGGHTACDIASKYGLFGVCIGLENSSIVDSIDEAQHLLRLELQYKAHIETVNAILNSASEGILAVDASGRVININSSARKIFDRIRPGDSLSSVVQDSLLIKSILEKVSLDNELITINNAICTVSSTVIHEGNKNAGMVLTFQPIKQVHTLEQSIRKKQAASGNVAKSTFFDIIGDSEIIRLTIAKAKRFSSSQGTILILGETGTGKELFAQSIHNYSSRASAPFVAINCAALPQNIFESELFGYVKGAFTGANAEGKAGYFEIAHTGTLFLDEISEMSLEMQNKLLRVLQEKEVRRIGDSNVFRVDTRIIAASNQDLFVLVKNGLFREDLYYRLSVLELRIPPLRQRKQDIHLISDSILSDVSFQEKQAKKSFTPEAKNMLAIMDWPGNVREVRNIIERLVIMCDHPQIDCNDIRKILQPNIENIISEEASTAFSSEGLKPERNVIANALRVEGGNRERAAERLGVSKTTLWRKMKEIRLSDRAFYEEYLNNRSIW